MNKKLFFIPFIFALFVLLTPVLAAEAADMSSSGNADYKVIDISHYNVTYNSGSGYDYSSINWGTLRSNVNAVYMKATEGSGYTDPTFASLATSAQQNGVSHGFYHYFWPHDDLSVDRAQADYFYDTIKDYTYQCLPVLDVEERNLLSKAQITASVTAFADEFKAKSGRDIMIYTYNNFAQNYLDTSLAHFKLWIANYSTYPQITPTWSKWDMWQYSDSVNVGGISGGVDANKATANIFLSSTPGLTWVDFPDGSYGGGDITVSGWALSSYGVSRVDIYVDGKGVGSVDKSAFTDRTDIQNKYGNSGFDNPLNSGYSYTIKDGSLQSGTHTIQTAAVDISGNAVWSNKKSFTVSVPGDQMCLDSPSGTYSGDVAVKGWAISRFGMNRADIYIDGNGYASIPASSFYERWDIVKFFGSNGYNDLAHSGFLLNIPNSKLSGGSHVISVAAVDNNGNATWSTKNFTLNAPANQMCLDTPSGTVSGDINVKGWAISRFGIKQADITVDGTSIASISNSSLYKRWDIVNIFGGKGYTDLEHSGFLYKIPNGTLTGGGHVMKVVVTDNNGIVTSVQRTINVSIPNMMTTLDSPTGNCGSSVTIKGWALSYYGIKSADVYIDGNGFTSIPHDSFTERTDVENMFGSLGFTDTAHSGYLYNVPTGTLSSGTHTIAVAAIDNQGNVLWSNQNTFTVS